MDNEWLRWKIIVESDFTHGLIILLTCFTHVVLIYLNLIEGYGVYL